MRHRCLRQRCPIGPDVGQALYGNAPHTTSAMGHANKTPRSTPVVVTLAIVAALATLALATLALAALAPAAAGAATTVTLALGTPGHGFGLTGVPDAENMGLHIAAQSASGGADLSLTLNPRAIWSRTAPWWVAPGSTGSVQWLGGGSTLVCAGGRVSELDADGDVVWSYTSADDASLDTPCWAREFTMGSDTYVLIADSGARRVFAVDRSNPDKPTVWQYGSGAAGTGVDRLSDPVCAEYLPAGTGGRPTVLIADADSTAPRVLEVRWGDYTKGAANGGFTASSVVWQYGGAAGMGEGQLIWPTDVERESDGSTLIADAGADRVIRVSGNGALVWQYGVSGEAGAAAGYLDEPMGASVEPNGNTVVADTGNGRVIVVRSADYSQDGGATHGFTAASILWQWAAGAGDALGQPRLAERVTGYDGPGRTADKISGALLVCDRSGQDYALLGNTGGARVDSRTFHLTTGGSQAHLLSLRVRASVPSHTSVTVYYFFSDGYQHEVKRPGTVSLRGAVSPTIWFDFVLTSSDLAVAPSLKDVVLTYTIGQTKASGSGNGGASRWFGFGVWFGQRRGHRSGRLGQRLGGRRRSGHEHRSRRQRHGGQLGLVERRRRHPDRARHAAAGRLVRGRRDGRHDHRHSREHRQLERRRAGGRGRKSAPALVARRRPAVGRRRRRAAGLPARRPAGARPPPPAAPGRGRPLRRAQGWA